MGWGFMDASTGGVWRWGVDIDGGWGRGWWRIDKTRNGLFGRLLGAGLSNVVCLLVRRGTSTKYLMLWRVEKWLNKYRILPA